jgi:hypothetical protein
VAGKITRVDECVGFIPNWYFPFAGATRASKKPRRVNSIAR